MSRFQPTRASSPSKHDIIPEHLAQSTTSDISLSSLAELKSLSRDDIDVLDAVVARAGPSSTAFSAVFTAYNDIINEGGLDSKEVMYYGKLLKLGTMKGKNWGEKWGVVKKWYDHHESPTVSGNNGQRFGRSHPAKHIRQGVSGRPVQQRHLSPTSDTSTTPSSGILPSRAARVPAPTQGLTRRPRGLTLPSEPSSSALDGAESNSLPSTPIKVRSTAVARHKYYPTKAELSDSDNSCAPSTTPPSYRAATRYTRPLGRSYKYSAPSSANDQDHSIKSTEAREVVDNARKQRVVDEAGAWDKIKIESNEAQADAYHKERLMERCWEVWKQGFQWIFTTNDQIVEARDNLFLRISFQRWRKVLASRNDLYLRVSTLSDDRCLRKTLRIWRARFRERGQEKWRQGLQIKRKIVHEKRTGNLRKNAWIKWRQSYRSHLSGQRYEKSIVHRFYHCWKGRLLSNAELEDIADSAFQATQRKAVERYWNNWKYVREMRASEHIIVERVKQRLLGNAIYFWQKSAHDYRMAIEVYQFNLIKATIKSWQSHHHQVTNMQSRVVKHIARQNNVLLRAVFRIWNARERGKLLVRVKATRLMKEIWSIWHQKLQRQNRNNDLAVAFALRAELQTIAGAIHKWRDVLMTHKNAHSFAVLFDASQIRYRMTLAWRIELRKKLKMVKIARMADHFFTSRRAWRAWRDVLTARAREQRLAEFKKRRLQRIFHFWLYQYQSRKQRFVAERVIKDYVNKRVLKDFLTVWTNRVIEIKVRELEVGQAFDLAVQATSIKRWHAAYSRHIEQLSLMENYLMIKKDESMRRTFNRWLTLTRITRRRRITLKEKEDEIKLSILASSWDRWTDRFSDERLRPIERDVLLQTQRNTLFRAFGIWHSKTKSLPAIRFCANNIRVKYFKLWRQTMPRALQAKEAREKDKKAVLSKFMDRWMQSHRTKVALKAVARARYLKLPTRQTRPALSTSVTKNPYKFPRSTVWRPTHDKDESSLPISDTRREATNLIHKNPTTGKSLGWPAPVANARESSPERSRTSLVDYKIARDVSPPLGSFSDTGKDDGQRSMLWHELREIRQKPRPSSLHSRIRNPL